MFHPELLFFVGIAVLADVYCIRLSPFYLNTQLAWCHLMSLVFVSVSYPCQSSLSLYQTNQITTMPVDRSLVMRALGGTITNSYSNDSESRCPTPQSSDCPITSCFNGSPWTHPRFLRHSLGDCYFSSVFILACTVVTLIQKLVHRVLFS